MGDIKIHIIYLLVLLTFFSACSIKEEVPGEPVTIGETKVRFELFTKAGTYGLPVSRAGENESVVDQQPWVLVFLGTSGKLSIIDIGKFSKSILYEWSWICLYSRQFCKYFKRT